MKWYTVLLVAVFVFVIPNLLFIAYEMPEQSQPLPQETVETIPEAKPKIQVKLDAEIAEMELDEYILGVVLGEMPASFEMEALKAQAVATRTYTLRKAMHQSKHEDADVCTDIGCCQAFMDPKTYLEDRGDQEALEKMRQAVRDSSGYVLTYGGELIEATYFSCSGGQTEDAVAVWGADVPYLQSVPSPGEEDSRHYTHTFQFTVQDFLRKLGLQDEYPLTEADFQISYTQGKGIDRCQIAGKSFSGTQLRSALSLPSTALSFSVENGEVTVVSKGNGHRVGMSQYGADAMASGGSDFAEILSHYYPGTKLEVFTDMQIQALFDKAGNL